MFCHKLCVFRLSHDAVSICLVYVLLNLVYVLIILYIMVYGVHGHLSHAASHVVMEETRRCIRPLFFCGGRGCHGESVKCSNRCCPGKVSYMTLV